MAERDLIVRIIGDDRQLQQAFTRSTRGAQQFDSQVSRTSRAGAALTRSFAGVAAGVISAEVIRRSLVTSINAASDLNEEVAKSGQVFGEASSEVESWAETTARGIGISRVEALKATGTFGNLFRVIDLAPQKSAEMSKALVELAADLASFNNANPEDVLIAIRSGLIGEAEPLRRYGVLLSEARVQQIALAQTGKQNVRELTAQEKALARYEIIMRDTALAQGDFERTSDGLANQTRVLRANFNDLAANMGSVLLPVVNDAITSANLLFQALDRFRGVDFTPGFDFPEPPSWLTNLALVPFSPALAGVGVARGLLDRGGPADTRPDAAGPGLGISRGIAERAEQAAREMQREALEANRAQRKQQAAFDALTKGLGLKLDKARITQDLGDDLDVLREIERAIERRIDREGKTFELVERLTAVRAELASAQESRARDQAERSRQAWEDTLDALNLRLDIASRTQSLQDDMVALRSLEQAIQRRISSEGRTTDLLRDLFEARERQRQVQQQMADRERQRRQEAARLRQGEQFEQLGLTPEGQPRVPGSAALQRRAQNLREQIRGTTLDTEKTGAQLDRISAVLRGKFGKVGRDVRRSILDMLNQISRALDQDSKATTGPLTKFAKRGVEDIIAGLGLTEEQAKELRQRMAQLGPGGSAPSKGIGAFGFRVPDTRSTQFAPDAFERAVEWHIYIDGEEVESRVTKRQQKKRGRSAPSRRGVRPGV